MNKDRHESYLDYLDNFKHNNLTLENMHRIHMLMLEDIESKEACMMTKELYKNIVDASVKYATMRMNPVENMEECERAETVLIHRFYNFSEHIKKVDTTPKWEEDLIHPLDKQFDKQRICDFACYLAFMKAINNRN